MIQTTLHVNSLLQKLAASSTLKRVPPTGAPKAADTPAAAPPDTRSRISWSDRNSSNSWKIRIEAKKENKNPNKFWCLIENSLSYWN